MCKILDGAIIGYAIVNIIEKYQDKEDEYVYNFYKEMVRLQNSFLL
ncbi:MAG: hypothetical protein SPJ17_05870 [Anaeroplasma sp.]|nr:hypothetical protein [Anaeroplasma sp.]MDY5983206.1 hypothetical protein [Anaeroplasma sp.]